MRRRDLIKVIAGSAAAWPLAARAQKPGKVYRIGFLANDPAIPMQPSGQAFLDGLREEGFIEDGNITIERRFAEARPDRYAELVTELIQPDVDVLVTSSDDATLAAKRTTTKIPIVMVNVNDPVAQGVVASLAHPGGNITGITLDDSPEITAKRMQFLKDAIPHAAKVAVLTDSDTPYRQVEWQELGVAARSLNVMLRRFLVRQAPELEQSFAAMEPERPDVLLLTATSFNFVHRGRIIEFAAKSRLPTMAAYREYPEAGALMSYCSVRADRYRRAAMYVAKILKGAKPADLPVEQPSKYELVINLKTARSLDLEIPRELLLVADEVIE